jgi:K+-sensing histidine kinase KdpD
MWLKLSRLVKFKEEKSKNGSPKSYSVATTAFCVEVFITVAVEIIFCRRAAVIVIVFVAVVVVSNNFSISAPFLCSEAACVSSFFPFRFF